MTFRFQTEIGVDGVIHLPPGVAVPSGKVDVIVVATEPADFGGNDVAVTGEEMFRELLQMASEYDWSDVPSDLAENHDHYAHGASKGIDKT